MSFISSGGVWRATSF